MHTYEIHDVHVNKMRGNAYSLSLFGCTLVISSTGIALIGSNSYEQSDHTVRITCNNKAEL